MKARVIVAWIGLLVVASMILPARADRNPHGQRAIFVESFGAGADAEAIRKRVVDRLEKSGEARVANKAEGADVILRGKAVIWPTGAISNNPRSNSTREQTYQGYLSVELADSSNRVLWSWLATPGRFRTTDIVKDLADQVASRLEREIRSSDLTMTAPAAASGAAHTELKAGGATFPAPLYMKWFESFQVSEGGFPISYEAIGSEAGLERLEQKKLDFAASDIRKPEAGLDAVYFPTVVGGVVPIYNLADPGHVLNLTPEVLADIYLGRIRKWNDPRLRQANGSAPLPDAEIAVVHRSDGSGTTYVWTSFLSLASPDWKARVGEGARVEWPTGTGAEGNEGVAAAVAKTTNSIGYVELTYAIQHRQNYGAVLNPAGRFIRADLPSITAAAASAHATADFRVSLLNSPAKDAYPISTFTWIVLPKTAADATKRAAIATFLRWMLNAGQKQCSSLGYVPLPRDVASAEMHAVEALK